jgi:hypothetical protein
LPFAQAAELFAVAVDETLGGAVDCVASPVALVAGLAKKFAFEQAGAKV